MFKIYDVSFKKQSAQLDDSSVYLHYIYIDTKLDLSYDVVSKSEITPCNKIDKWLVVYVFGNVMTYITTLRT